MPEIQISTPFNIDIEFEIAAFHKRLLAYLVRHDVDRYRAVISSLGLRR